MKHVLFAAVGVSLLAGCSKPNDYTPAEGMTGEAIFKATCAECHSVDEKGYYFELASDADIGKKVREGGMMMPSFPNISGDALKSVEAYVAANSSVAK